MRQAKCEVGASENTLGRVLQCCVACKQVVCEASEKVWT